MRPLHRWPPCPRRSTTYWVRPTRSLPSVAVRSSAIDEDGTLASFAGQHATYLNVVGVDAVAAAVVRCWASLASEQTHAYRRQHGLALEPARLAVLVQQLVAADVAA